MKIPLHYSGEEESPAVKLGKALVNHILNELEVSCLPADLPESIRIDLSKLEIGSALTLKDIQLPQGVEAVLHGHSAEDIALVSVVMPAAEEPAESETAAAPAAGTATSPAAEGEKK
jgi:large subunit ribosomal protein L25